MRRIFVVLLVSGFLGASLAYAGLMDKVRDYREKTQGTNGEPDTNTVIAGLKEALNVGARNGVSSVSKPDGYFGNQLIRIPMPPNIERIERTLRRYGMHKEADAFILSMNRAAEKAAPQALSFFVAAVREMSIPDAVKILHGGDTAATDFLKAKTYDRIYGAFKPAVSSAMSDVGVTRSFKQMMDKARTVPFLKSEVVDLDSYVTSKALDGLFVVVGQEERKIRKDPKTRVTELLRTIFK